MGKKKKYPRKLKYIYRIKIPIIPDIYMTPEQFERFFGWKDKRKLKGRVVKIKNGVEHFGWVRRKRKKGVMKEIEEGW